MMTATIKNQRHRWRFVAIRWFVFYRASLAMISQDFLPGEKFDMPEFRPISRPEPLQLMTS
jgi:hypothetical protein